MAAALHARPLLCSLAVALTIATPQATPAAYPTGPQITDRYAAGGITVRLSDAFTAPKSSLTAGAQVARINFLRSEPVESLADRRLFVNDMNGSLSVVDRSTGAFTRYLDFDAIFNGVGSGDFDADPGYAAGLVTMQFDPAYGVNGKFYTVHTELGVGSATAYRQAVVTEWQDANITDTSFTGTRAELLRVQYVAGIHPLGDIAFNPAAADATHPDWRAMYITSGDGGAGETSGTARSTPQRLDALMGKVLRIRTDQSLVTGSYSIPLDNPFAAAAWGAHPAVFASGLRNPHRLAWDVDDDGVSRGIIADIGLRSYEEVNLLSSGANYGYSPIEGSQVLGTNNIVSDAPLPATLPVITASGTVAGGVAPTYPVALYSHRDGDAISGGFVYRGTAIPALRGKYVFGDIANGRLFYTDMAALVAADDGDPATTATIHELNVLYDDPATAGGVASRRVFDIVRDRWDVRNETAVGSITFAGVADGDRLPGSAASTNASDPYGTAYGGGRADIRVAELDGELYLISKSDGMVRRIGNAIGDANFDGAVGAADLQIVAARYGMPGSFADGDFDLSGVVDAGDLRELAATYLSAGVGDITSAALATLPTTVTGEWAAAIAAVPPPPTITIDVPAATRTQAQAARPRLNGRLNLLKTGSGTLVIDRTNTLSGTVAATAGEVRLAVGTGLGAATLAPAFGATVTLAPGLSATVDGIDLEAGGLVDLGDGVLTISDVSSVRDVVGALVVGRRNSLGIGTGIVSSRAEADQAAGIPRTIGWLEDGRGGLTLAFAAPGDANLDGGIDILDAAGFLAAGRFDTGGAAAWSDGDFTYDGIVDILDVGGLLATALFDAGQYRGGAGALPAAPVPEPSHWLAAVAVGAAALSGRRRPQRRAEPPSLPLPE
jgi:autotransporter-associated beta strand protein